MAYLVRDIGLGYGRSGLVVSFWVLVGFQWTTEKEGRRSESGS
jgi:hypothetical protein